MDINVKTNAELTPTELQERNNRRAATQTQILNDQASNAKRDKKALAAEAAWFRKYGKK